MMESSNNVSLDLHHYYQEELHGRSSSSSSSFQFVGRDYDWINQDHLLLNNGGDFLDPNSNVGSVLTSQEMMTPAGVMQDLGFQWDPLLLNGEGYYMIDNNNNYNSTTTPSSSPSSSSYSHQLAHFSKQMKEELPLGLINGNHLVQDYFNQISSGLHQQPAFGPGPGGSFGMVLPSANISSSMSNGSSCLGMDQFQAVNQPSLGNNISNMAAFYRESFDYATFGQLQAQEGVSKLPSHSLSGVTEAKRTNSGHGDSRSYQSIAKRPRFESRSSFAPFKVRKEKLGDRIASLQQLVAPFGKTDTASVLMEAIGYIKFLQDQVETLSVPYMRSSNTKLRVSQGASNDEKDEAKPDLRSRGLCLVPLSCTSYVDTNENGGVWSPPNYGGGI